MHFGFCNSEKRGEQTINSEYSDSNMSIPESDILMRPSTVGFVPSLEDNHVTVANGSDVPVKSLLQSS
jgi:hypothetical protein